MSMISIAFALLFYVAGALFIAAVCTRAVQLVSRWPEAKPFPHDRDALGRLERRICDTVLFRDLFYADFWAWLLRICFALGIAAMLARHLRYVVAPSGPTWKAVVLAQVPGLYGGLLFLAGLVGLWVRRIVVKELRATTSSTEHALFGAAALAVVLGYANTLFGTPDIVAVKTFMQGLLTFQWDGLPSDGLLLAHLWLGAMVMGAVPFTKAMGFRGLSGNSAASAEMRNALLGLLGILLIVSGGLALVSPSSTSNQAPDFATLVQTHQKKNHHAMTVFHPQLLMVHRNQVVHKGERMAETTIERCVTCHVADPGGQPVGYDDDRHFCKSCHEKLAVAMDCFECHNAKPIPDLRAALEPKTRGTEEKTSGKEP